MIYIDSAEGSRQLMQHFRPREVELVSLGFADVAFEGNISSGSGIIGIEYKKVTELIGSIVSSRLVGEQLPKLCASSDVAYLLIEGYFRKDKCTSAVTTLYRKSWMPYRFGKQNVEYERIRGTLTTLTEKCGVRVVHTGNLYDTVTYIRGLKSWWSKQWDSHNSGKGYYMGITGRVYGRVPLVTKYATQLPGVGWEKATWIGEHWSLEKYFEVVKSQDRAAWESVPGISKKTSLRIINYLKGELKSD